MSALVEHRTGTRWGRAVVASVVGFVLLGAMASAAWKSLLGFDGSLLIQNSSASFSTSELVAQDAGFGMAPVQQSDGTWKNVLRAGFASAQANGLCVSKTETIAGLTMTLRLTSSDGDPSTTEIEANNAGFDLQNLRANGTGVLLQGSTQIGLSTPDITTSPGSAPYTANPLSAPTDWSADYYDDGDGDVNGGRTNGQGYTGIDATVGRLNNASGVLWDAQVTGDIMLPNLTIAVEHGAQASCADRAANGIYPQ